MILRADHVAGAGFVAFGALVIALSGDLPVGQLAMPGSGFLPTIVAALTIVFGLALIARARESGPFSEVPWSDGKHASLVTVITAAAIAFYEHLGFMLTMGLMMIVLLILVERRNPLRAGVYGISIVLFTYISFAWGLKTPLPEFSFSF